VTQSAAISTLVSFPIFILFTFDVSLFLLEKLDRFNFNGHSVEASVLQQLLRKRPFKMGLPSANGKQQNLRKCDKPSIRNHAVGLICICMDLKRHANHRQPLLFSVS